MKPIYISERGVGGLKRRLHDILKWGHEGLSDQYLLLLFRTDGLIITSIPELSEDDLDIGSAIYSLVAGIQKLAYNVGIDNTNTIILTGNSTSVVIVIRDEIGVMAISDRSVNLGLILLQLETILDKCLEVLARERV